MQENNQIRIVMAMPGTGGPSAAPLVQALNDGGIETFTGPLNTVEQVVEAAIEKNADAVCISSVQGEHHTLFARTIELLRERGADRVTVFGGGVIPLSDVPALKELGVAQVFTAGTVLPSVARWVHENVKPGAGAK
ncbi:cobalamin B12-binding domain-containing protein [Kitasatospora sp. NPDC089509]|uniref:cobalamin B12-binding domain-containing protein n=1 Tax=Kitasatospora sp. NPDC089509 TaxID=3364079 RepID=UPI0037FA352E